MIINFKIEIKLIPKFIDNPDDFMKASDVFVFPTYNEGLGTPFLESIACGVPVIVNNIPGVFDEWVEYGKNGFIVPLIPNVWASHIKEGCKIHSKRIRRILKRF